MIIKELTLTIAITIVLITKVPLIYIVIKDIIVIYHKVLTIDCLTIIGIIIITIIIETIAIFVKIIIKTLKDIILRKAIIDVSIDIAGVDR